MAAVLAVGLTPVCQCSCGVVSRNDAGSADVWPEVADSELDFFASYGWHDLGYDDDDGIGIMLDDYDVPPPAARRMRRLILQHPRPHPKPHKHPPRLDPRSGGPIPPHLRPQAAGAGTIESDDDVAAAAAAADTGAAAATNAPLMVQSQALAESSKDGDNSFDDAVLDAFSDVESAAAVGGRPPAPGRGAAVAPQRATTSSKALAGPPRPSSDVNFRIPGIVSVQTSVKDDSVRVGVGPFGSVFSLRDDGGDVSVDVLSGAAFRSRGRPADGSIDLSVLGGAVTVSSAGGGGGSASSDDAGGSGSATRAGSTSDLNLAPAPHQLAKSSGSSLTESGRADVARHAQQAMRPPPAVLTTAGEAAASALPAAAPEAVPGGAEAAGAASTADSSSASAMVESRLRADAGSSAIIRDMLQAVQHFGGGGNYGGGADNRR